MRRHNQRVYRAARADFFHGDAEAEDVMQDSYVRAYQNLRQFAGRAQFSTWISPHCGQRIVQAGNSVGAITPSRIAPGRTNRIRRMDQSSECFPLQPRSNMPRPRESASFWSRPLTAFRTFIAPCSCCGTWRTWIPAARPRRWRSAKTSVKHSGCIARGPFCATIYP